MQRIFVGDVQGCGEELDHILARADEAFGEDARFQFVGDLINRGPRDLQVLEAVRRRAEEGRAVAVLGNHELSFLRLHYGLREVGPLDTMHEVLARPDGAEWVAWVRRLPILWTGTLGGRPAAMVHAASAPGWSLDDLEAKAGLVARILTGEDEAAVRALLTKGVAPPDAPRDDLARMTTCRSVHDGGWSSKEPELAPGPGARPWHRDWLAAHHPHGLVYGHWAMQGLHVAPGLRGLDSACVWGGELTAWLPDETLADPFASRDPAQFWHVAARERRGPL